MSGGWEPKGRHPHTGGVQHERGVSYNSKQHAEASENIQLHRGIWGHVRVYTPRGHTNVQGAYKHTGAYECRGHPDTPSKKHVCL